ncbi:hypothetical protein UYO_0072 [Lachnospiraceae bacterium JC7]|nr:hypothetical protein UYO_0072 [Lachnospiraceae bacterium JC7]
MQRNELNNIFRALLTIVTAEGRGKALFGDKLSLAEESFDRAISGQIFPTVYLEFPLIGNPCFDMLVTYGETLFRDGIDPSAQAFGYRKALDCFATFSGRNAGFGYSIDLSRGDTEQAGLYLQHQGDHSLIEPFLRACGEEARLPYYLDISERLKKYWQSAYIAFFPGRPGTPTRIGGYKFGSYDLRTLFDLAGFTAWGPDMIELCDELITICRPSDFQFDILSDGSVSDVFGLGFAFGAQKRPKIGEESLRSDKGARFMNRLQEMKLIDDRWKMIPDAVFARAYPVESEDGNKRLIALAVLLSYVKIKFKAGVPQTVKFYLALKASEL